MIRVDTIKNRDSFAVLTVVIIDKLLEVMRKERPEIAGNLPFRNGWVVECHCGEDYMVIKYDDAPGIESPLISEMEKGKLELLKARVRKLDKLDFENLYSEFGEEWYEHDKFLYIAPAKLNTFEERWNSIKPQLWNWADCILIPKLFELEKKKLNIILPKPAEFKISEVVDSLWILECEETSLQGSAFALENIGIITCDHVLGSNTKAFKANNISKKYDIEIIKRHNIIDIAIIKLVDYEVQSFLKKGSTDDIRQLDSAFVAGFPNYRFGDSGNIIVGNISGFRMVSGIRRLLVSMPLIAGNSGSPIFNNRTEVVGVAVTGADRMENAHNTEYHGAIPIEALELI